MYRTSIIPEVLLTFSYIRDMSTVANGLYELEQRCIAAQVGQASDIAGELEGYVQSITWHVSDLQVGILPYADYTRKVSSQLGQYRFPSSSAFTFLWRYV